VSACQLFVCLFVCLGVQNFSENPIEFTD